MSVPTPEELASIPPAYLAEDQSHRLVAVAITFMVLLSITFGMFVVSRLFFSERNGWEIWLLYPLAYLSSLGICVISIVFVNDGGVGRHFLHWYINDSTVITLYLRLQTGTEFLYMLAVTAPKLAILTLYMRIFPDRRLRLLAWIAVGVVIAHFLATGVIAWLTICRPFAFKWDKTIPGGKCADLIAAYIYTSIPNIVTDLAILLLPLPTLWSLNTSRMRKVGLFFTFLLGSLGIITAIVRMVGFKTVDLAADLTWHSTDTMIYTIIEPAAYFMCSCFPGIRPLFMRAYGKATKASGASGSYRSTNAESSAKIHSSLPLSYLRNGQDTSVMVATANDRHFDDDDTAGFIRLDETFDIQYSQADQKQGRR